MWGAWQYWLPSWAPDLAVPSLQAITQAEALVKTIEGGSPSPSQVAHVAAAASKAAAAAGQAAALTGSGRDQARAAQAAAFLAAARAEGGAGAATEVLDSIRETVKACQAVVKGAQGVARAATMQWMAIGSIVGAILGGLIGDWLGRRRSYALLCLCSIAVALPLYFTVHEFGTRFIVLTCLSGIPITAFFGWLPLYLPELYPTRLRATGEGFCFNVGRVISAVGVFGTGILAKSIGIPHAAAYMSAIFLLGLPLIALAPETKGEELPE
jgi:MFS family permease